MFCYPFFEILGMTSVVGIISTTQNINPETHFLSFQRFLALLHSSVTPTYVFGALRHAQGERNLVIIIFVKVVKKNPSMFHRLRTTGES
jgi:hypothetical protein